MILVVGGAGYIGSQLVKSLVDDGIRVKVLDRGYFGFDSLMDILPKIQLYDYDMRNCPHYVFDNVDTVINLGGLSNDPTADYSPEANTEMNVTASEKLAVMAKDSGVERYVYASSCSIYDRGVFDESKDVLLDEDSEVSPTSNYAVSKLEAEQKLMDLVDDNFKVICLRKGTVFGQSPRMRYDLVVNTMVMSAMKHGIINVHNNGAMWRPMLNILDAVKAYRLASTLDVSGIFNVASFNTRISELAFKVYSRLNTDVGFNFSSSESGVRSYRVSCDKFKKLGWTHNHELDDAIDFMLSSIKFKKDLSMEWESPINYNIKWLETIDKCADVLKNGKRSYECI